MQLLTHLHRPAAWHLAAHACPEWHKPANVLAERNLPYLSCCCLDAVWHCTHVLTLVHDMHLLRSSY